MENTEKILVADTKTILVVAGDFNESGGRSSSYADKLFAPVIANYNAAHFMNGGNIQQLLDLKFAGYSTIIWTPNIPNEIPKLVNRIKEENPHCVLVTSKNNAENKYSRMDIVARALNSKSSLLIEFHKGDRQTILGTIWDPLGNIYAYFEDDIHKLSQALWQRIYVLKNVTRIGSESIGSAIKPKDDPNVKKFCNMAQKLAERFHDLIHPVNSERFVGNLSFRCENGFPSFRSDNHIFVSRRNIDKRLITPDGFVGVKPIISHGKVQYFGDIKPSVDAPVHLGLYGWYKHINYILHSHVYVKNAPFTRLVVPCGALEELDDIVDIFPHKDLTECVINQRGHGSIIMLNKLDDSILSLPFEARDIPERQL